MSAYQEILKEQELSRYAGEDRMVSAKEALELIRSEERTQLHILSKIPALDETVGGFYAGQLIVISGTSGHGKTTLAQSFTSSFYEQGVRLSWFSYEVETEDFLSQFDEAVLPHFYIPLKMTARTTNWLHDRMLEASLKYGATVVFIDHLHYLMDFHRTNNISFDIGAICRNLKEIAKNHRMIIFLICHTTKTNPDKELDLGDVRDSSFIEQEADCVMYLWRDKTHRNGSVVKIAKNRKRGVIGRIIGLQFVDRRYYERAGFSEEAYRAQAGSGSTVGQRTKNRVSEDDDNRWNY